jgi:hypothetical protein
LDAECGVLVGDDVVLIFWVHGHVLRLQVDCVWEQGQAREFFEEVGVRGVVEV